MNNVCQPSICAFNGQCATGSACDTATSSCRSTCIRVILLLYWKPETWKTLIFSHWELLFSSAALCNGAICAAGQNCVNNVCSTPSKYKNTVSSLSSHCSGWSTLYSPRRNSAVSILCDHRVSLFSAVFIDTCRNMCAADCMHNVYTSLPVCAGQCPLAANGLVCSGRGFCNTEGLCVCEPNWTGLTCSGRDSGIVTKHEAQNIPCLFRDKKIQRLLGIQKDRARADLCITPILPSLSGYWGNSPSFAFWAPFSSK